MRLRVLLVDDDAATLYTIRHALKRLDLADVHLDVETVASGEEAVEVLTARGRELDLVVCDYKMGPMTGTEVLEEARECAPQALRVLMSGFADAEVVEEARARDTIHEFREKPMDYARFGEVLRELVDAAVIRGRSTRAA